ncbi:MAG TPA: glucose-6-phosphate dehydrogenase assembly protein OpcA [Spirochaetia bacterium]|nr:glucose-6-phosphate dehydrogenase assembly protein OpcA [Spirochaetia bacterium]
MSDASRLPVLDPRAIEEEIIRIRERESNPYSSGVKTNIFTLVIFRSADPEAPGASVHVEAALQFLLGKRPARIITIHQGSAPRTEVWVSGRCYPDRRNRGVCFEEVRIESGDDGVGADPGAWAPLVIRDLPVFAWMPDGLGTAAELWTPSLRGAAGLIDKLMVDSSRGPEDRAAVIGALGRIRETTSDAFLVSDFSWRRGKVLREQAARSFDPPEMRGLLPRVRSARLYGGSRMEAWLFFEWLSSRLGRAIPGEHAWEGPLSEGFRLTISVEGAADVEIGCTRGGCLERGEEKGAYRFPTDGEVLLEEVDTLARDAVFGEVLSRGGASS